MKILLLLFAALLVAGCGEKVSPHLKYETEGGAVTITGCDKKVACFQFLAHSK